MNLKEKLAHEWWLKNRDTVFAQGPAFEAGFDAAIDLIIERLKTMQPHSSDYLSMELIYITVQVFRGLEPWLLRIKQE